MTTAVRALLLSLCLPSVLTGCELIASLDRNQLAPQVSLAALPDEGAAPLKAELSWTVYDEDSADVSCVLDFGDGQQEDLASCQDLRAVFHDYEVPGGYVARLSVSDGEFTTSAVVSVRVAEVELGAELSLSEARGAAPFVAEFTWSVAGNPARCTLDFGDGTRDEVACELGVHFHTYEHAGAYVATFEAATAKQRARSAVGVRVDAE